MAKKETKKEAPKTVETPKEPVVVAPEPKAEKVERTTIVCTHCKYTVAKLNNEALIGMNCPKCKENGKLL